MNKKILYCTIAIGDFYLNSAINFANKLNDYSNNHHMLIVTNKKNENFENTTFEEIPDDHILFIRNVFNYMLKYYPLYLANKLDYDNIIFVDADWRLKSNYDEKNVDLMFNYMDQNNIDLFFERPHRIGDGKYSGINCFWQHKIDFYKLKETNEYDNGHVCNEQFMVFKKTEKFNSFVNKFKELYYISSEHQLWPFAEGLEIGMSMAYSGMRYSWMGWQNFLKEMFEFNSIDGGLNIRF